MRDDRLSAEEADQHIFPDTLVVSVYRELQKACQTQSYFNIENLVSAILLMLTMEGRCPNCGFHI